MSFEQKYSRMGVPDTDLNIKNSQSKMIKEKEQFRNEIISYAKENNLDSAVIKLKDSKLKILII